jgi:propionyl-CoA carboxylase beta chain
MGRPFIQN